MSQEHSFILQAAVSAFKARSVFRNGDIPPQDNSGCQLRPDSGFVALVCSEQGQGLSARVGLAMTFLVKHEKELDHLKLQGVDNMLLDFGVELGDEIQHSEYLPPELLMSGADTVSSDCSARLPGEQC
jgi:hypothetical protein